MRFHGLLVALSVSIAASACGEKRQDPPPLKEKPPPAAHGERIEDVVSPTTQFAARVDEFCACKDDACVSALENSYAKWLSKSGFDVHRAFYDRDPVAARLVGCVRRLVRPGPITLCASKEPADTPKHIELYSGHPTERAQLKYNEVLERPKRYVNNLESFGGFYWAKCVYSDERSEDQRLPLGDIRCESDKSMTCAFAKPR